MVNVLEEFFDTPVPAELWHYTKVEGLRGILSSQTIWATEAHHTTDPTEFIHAREIAVATLEALTPENQHAEQAKGMGLEMVRSAFDDAGLLSPQTTEVFIASFSSAQDLKSQWTVYSASAHGVSLSFDLTRFRPPKSLELAITLAPCIYLQAKKEELIECALSHFMTTTELLLKQTADPSWSAGKIVEAQHFHGRLVSYYEYERFVIQEAKIKLDKAFRRTSFDLLRLASHCKDYSYREELEWRLALPAQKDKPESNIEVLYRGGVPYIAFDLFRNGDRLPVKRVMTGFRCPDVAAVENIVARSGFEVPVSKSGIPYRNQ